MMSPLGIIDCARAEGLSRKRFSAVAPRVGLRQHTKIWIYGSFRGTPDMHRRAARIVSDVNDPEQTLLIPITC